MASHLELQLSAKRKARIVGSVLLLIALWPIAHRQLVARFDINPWKLYGFAMYCTPHHVVVDIVDRSGSEPRRLEPEAFPPRLRHAHERFSARRSTLGVLHEPDELARAVLETLPEVRAFSVAVRIFSLQWRDAEITHRTRLHAFDRKSFR